MKYDVEAVLFDMGGVLLESADMWDAAGFAKSFPDGIPDDLPIDWFLALSKALIAAFEALPQPRHALDTRPIIADWLRQLGHGATKEEVDRLYAILARWEVRPLYEHVPATILTLRQMGYRLGLVSNTLMVSDAHRTLFKEAGIFDAFDVLVFSAEFGMNKPDTSIFTCALDAMNVAPNRAWYVGDKPHRDVCGARRVGMTSVLVDGPHLNHLGDGDDHWPELMIPDISALPGLLEMMQRIS
ncbi:MAG: HAD family hydrolase [Candidatus Hydrogenedentes bacterium]|nr:HAD family hydrolase [Candidatus Hydrogenedentota bacterium]